MANGWLVHVRNVFCRGKRKMWQGDGVEGNNGADMPGKGSSVGRANAPIDAPERRRLPVLLRRAWYGLNQAFRRRLLPLGLTPDQFTVLRTLLENPGISQRKLAELMSSDANTVAALVARVEKMGLVERQTRERDRRANSLRLRPLGKRKYEAARKVAVK